MKLGVLGLSALLCASVPALPSFGQSTEFTYQGKLELAGESVSGLADFQFRLFNSTGGSTQIGSTQNFDGVTLNHGTFAVALNFGEAAFNGNDRFLEVAVRAPAGVGNYVILSPRQKISPTPYALKVLGLDGHSLDSADGSAIDALFVNAAGNVGMGTTLAQRKLHVSAPESIMRLQSTSDNTYSVTEYQTDADLWHTGVGGSNVGNPLSGSYYIFDVNAGAARMVINDGGGVGIGTMTPQRRLHISDAGIYTARFENYHPIGAIVEFSSATGEETWELAVAGSESSIGETPGAMYIFNQGMNAPAVHISPGNGFVGIGDMDPGYKLELPNFANEWGRARSAGWVTYSSIRWKDNVQELDGALDTLKQLRGVRFDWKPEHGGAHDIGFVAEEVGHIVPELVTWEDDGKFAKGLAYDRITALAVEAIKQQQAQIEEQQRQIDSMKQAHEDLRAQFADLAQSIVELRGEKEAAAK